MIPSALLVPEWGVWSNPVYDWAYDADSRYLVNEYCWVSAEDGVNIVYRRTGRRARLVDSTWVLEP